MRVERTDLGELGGEHEQNTPYEILKGLIKYYFKVT